jgi:hypothetical protein
MPTKLGPTQEAIRVLALHLPKSDATPLAPTPPSPSAPKTAEDIVLKSLMAGQGQGPMDHPAQAPTVQALLEALTRGRA